MTSIEWTDQTWNPVTGCDRVSPGCKHCYALDLAARLKAMGQERYQRDGQPPTSGPGFGVTLHHDKVNDPLRWRKPRMVFVNSMSDLFHPEIPDDFIVEVFHAMFASPQHTFQVLTKRPERMAELVTTIYEEEGGMIRCAPNIWLGTSIESRTYIERADHVRQTPAAVRFISAEPLLGPLTVGPGQTSYEGDKRWLDLTGIDWLIVGGESGPKHRSMDPQWVRDLRDACDPGGHSGAVAPQRLADESLTVEPGTKCRSRKAKAISKRFCHDPYPKHSGVGIRGSK